MGFASSRSRFATLPVAGVLLVAVGCAPAERTAPPEPARILLVGVDGLEWSVAAPMVRRGELPNLRTLMERGAWGTIETSEPTLSPVVWTTIATGKTPEEHGIHHFILTDRDAGQGRLYNRLDRRAKAFWNILSDAGQRVHVVGWFLTYPAEAIRGFMVSQFTSLDRAREFWKGTLEEKVPGQTHPESLLEELAGEIRSVPGEMDMLSRRIFDTDDPASVGGLEARLVEHTLWALEADALYGRIAERIIRSDPDFDVMAVYFGGPDVVGHRFWRYAYPDAYRFPPTEERQRRFGGVIARYYGWVDEWIGRLAEACGEEVVVLVVSDHGMAPINLDVPFERLERVQQMNSGHHLEAAASPGVLVAAGPGIRRTGADPGSVVAADLESLGSVLGITPTLLYLRGLPVGRDMAAGPIEPLLADALLSGRPVEWIETHEHSGRDHDAGALDPEMEREMMERFKSLGYLGD